MVRSIRGSSWMRLSIQDLKFSVTSPLSPQAALGWSAHDGKPSMKGERRPPASDDATKYRGPPMVFSRRHAGDLQSLQLCAD